MSVRDVEWDLELAPESVRIALQMGVHLAGWVEGLSIDQRARVAALISASSDADTALWLRAHEYVPARVLTEIAKWSIARIVTHAKGPDRV